MNQVNEAFNGWAKTQDHIRRVVNPRFLIVCSGKDGLLAGHMYIQGNPDEGFRRSNNKSEAIIHDSFHTAKDLIRDIRLLPWAKDMDFCVLPEYAFIEENGVLHE